MSQGQVKLYHLQWCSNSKVPFLHGAPNTETVSWNKMNPNSPSNYIRPNCFLYFLMHFHLLSQSPRPSHSHTFFPLQAQNLGSGPTW